MPEPRNTDERLRYYLNNRQSDRERMCIELLASVPGYKDLEPRRPEGGPDGGRDLQGTFNGMKLFGAVGFKNDANGSPQQTREILKKFEDDLQSALTSAPEIKAFTFLTNIDLTQRERDQLRSLAMEKGICHVEIFWRERLRLLLDRPEGYATRHNYLDISLSEAEQKTFFDRFGKDLQNLIAGRLDSIEERMEEILFRNWKRGRCRSISIEVKLKELYRVDGDDHEPYRFGLRLHRVLQYGEGEMLFGCYSMIHQDGRRADYERRSFFYSETDMMPAAKGKTIELKNRVRMAGQPFQSIEFGCSWSGSAGLTSEVGLDVSELEQYVIDFYCDTSWSGRVACVEVWYDDYLVYVFQNHENAVRVRDAPANVKNWLNKPEALGNRPVQYWSGWAHGLDQVCERRRVGDYRRDLG